MRCVPGALVGSSRAWRRTLARRTHAAAQAQRDAERLQDLSARLHGRDGRRDREIHGRSGPTLTLVRPVRQGLNHPTQARRPRRTSGLRALLAQCRGLREVTLTSLFAASAVPSMLARFLSLVVLLSCPAQTPAFLVGVAPATRSSARSSVFRQQRQARCPFLAQQPYQCALSAAFARARRTLRTASSRRMPLHACPLPLSRTTLTICRRSR